MNNTENTAVIADDAKATSAPPKKGFHPKRFLKNCQQMLYRSPYAYLAFCFLLPILIMYIGYLVKGIHPFGSPFYDGKDSALVLDLYHQYVHFFETLRSFVLGDGSLLYSFSRSLGGEFMGMVAYYMASPLTYIVVLFPKERIQEAVLCILLLKTGLSGLSFGFYLHKHSKKANRLAIVMFSCLYALTAYAVVQQSNTMWIDALVLLPLFAYALERLISSRKYKLYVITLAAILVCNYYIGYMVCIFAVLYFFYYYFSKSRDEINPNGEKLHFLRTGLRFALFSILSAAIAAFMLIAAYYSLGFGKSDFSSPSWSMSVQFDVLDFLTKFLPGAYDTVEPKGLPFVYCGLLTLISIPVYFTAKRISNREKIASAALIAVFLISLIISPIDLIWHGFSVPNWLNARYSFMFCFVLLMLAYKGFGNLKQAGEKFVIVLGGLIVLFVAVAQKFEMDSYINTDGKLLTLESILFSIFFTIALVVLLCLRIRTKNKNSSRSVSAVLTAIICLELCCNTCSCMLRFNQDVSFATYDRFQDHFNALRPVVEQVKEQDNSFYRMENTKSLTKNDNMTLGLRGITNSTSTLNSSAINFVEKMGYTGRAHLTMYRGGTPFSDSLLGIKYVIDSGSSQRFSSFYTQLEGIDSTTYKVMQNPYAMSIAYGVDSDFKDVLNLNNYDTVFRRYNAMASAMLGDKTVTKMFNPVYGMTTSNKNCEISSNSSYVKCSTPEDSSGTVKFTYTAPYTGDYYFYSPADCKEELTIKVNGTAMGNYLGRDTTHILHVGYHEAGSTIEIEMTIPRDQTVKFHTRYEFLWYLDNDVYNDVMTRLQSGPQFEISDNSTDDHLTGSIVTSNADQMILTTIPYDEGWKVYVDGAEVEIYETMDALLAFDIAEGGEHTLELRYMPDCYILGAIISISGICFFILLCAVELILKKTKLKKVICKNYAPDYWVLEDFEEVEAPCSLPNGDTNAQHNIQNEQCDVADTEITIEELQTPDAAPTNTVDCTDVETSEQVNSDFDNTENS